MEALLSVEPSPTPPRLYPVKNLLRPEPAEHCEHLLQHRVELHQRRRHTVKFQHRVPPAAVYDPEASLVNLVVNIVKALVLEHSQRDKAQRSHGKVSLASNLFWKPLLHKVEKPDRFDSVLSSFPRQP